MTCPQAVGLALLLWFCSSIASARFVLVTGNATSKTDDKYNVQNPTVAMKKSMNRKVVLIYDKKRHEAYIQSIVLKKTLEGISLDQRPGFDENGATEINTRELSAKRVQREYQNTIQRQNQ
ncbi:unnamed protein product [Thelazia callipaeda]|uniref:RxLR effector protein n=1 Tax=Thelazia callipaeda TaxID=103827 RepID=A0A0N5D0S4_THECL|nr:unnamed protein product [Thelazia callipaeda]